MSDRKGLMALIARNTPNVPSVLADKILGSRWLAEHDRRVAERAWDEAIRPQHRDLEELLMSTDYEPTTEQVRSHYVFDQGDVWRRERGEAFDHWLAAHDREVAAKALEDAAEDFRVREEQQKRAEAEAVIARIEQLCAETDVDTTEATQAWLVGNIGAVLASYKTTNDENGSEW